MGNTAKGDPRLADHTAFDVQSRSSGHEGKFVAGAVANLHVMGMIRKRGRRKVDRGDQFIGLQVCIGFRRIARRRWNSAIGMSRVPLGD